MNRFLKSAFLILVFTFTFNISAFAGLPVHEIHNSKVDIVNGITDFSTAKFSHLEIFFASSDAEVKEHHLHVTGNLKLSSGNYSYWDGLNVIHNSGEGRTLKLALGNDITQTGSHQSIKFIPVNDSGEQIYFYSEADSGLNGVEATWRLTDAKEFNSYTNLPTLRQTARQLSTFVPYIEYNYVTVEVEDENDNDESESEDENNNDESENEDENNNDESESEDENNNDESENEDENDNDESESENENVNNSSVFRKADEVSDTSGYISGFNLRVVNSNNTSVPVNLTSRVTLTIEDIYTVSGDTISFQNESVTASEGENLVVSMDFGGMISEDFIAFITVRLDVSENNTVNTYRWRFYGNKNSGVTSLLSNHVSDAKFKNDASYYKGAKFKGLYLTLNNPFKPVESQYITKGSITIPSGGYSLYDADSSNKVSSVPEGTSKTLPLIPALSLSQKKIGLEYFIGNDTGKRRRLLLKDDVEKNLGGKTLTWTFPSDLNLNGSAVLPDYLTTDEQLETFVPFVETISSDTNSVSALRYRLVNPDDTGNPVSPDYRVDFKISVAINDVYTYESGWLNESIQGAVELSSTYSIYNITCISVMIRVFDNDSNPASYTTYQWNFKGTKKSSDSAETEGFDGCNLNYSLTGIFAVIAFIIFRKFNYTKQNISKNYR